MWTTPSQSIVLRRVLQSMSRKSRLSAYRPSSCCFLSSSSKSNHAQGKGLPENSRTKNWLRSTNPEKGTFGLNHSRHDDYHDNISIKYKKHLLKSKENFLSQARNAMNGILGQISAFENANASGRASRRPIDQQEQHQHAATDEYQMELFQETRDIFQLLVRNVEDGTLNPSGKHGKQISNFLELILVAYSRLNIQHDSGKQDSSVYAACMEIIHALEQWNLDCQNSHYECVIACASREERWNEAATLYWKLIDPEAGGKPVDLQVDNPLGLFAIACAFQENAATTGGIMSSSAVEQVFDAVLRMSMISPSDQSKCKSKEVSQTTIIRDIHDFPHLGL
jgi:hypothetical protein